MPPPTYLIDRSRMIPRRVSVDERPLVIGRSQDCGLIVGVTRASRHHARIVREGDQLWLEDLDSRNGTFLNGAQVRGRALLHHGDVVGIVGRDYEVVIETSPTQTAAPQHLGAWDAPVPRLGNASTLREGSPEISWVLDADDQRTILESVHASDLNDQHTTGFDARAALEGVERITGLLSQGVGRDELLDQILEIVFELEPAADVGVILLGEDDLDVAAVRGSSREVEVSRTVVDQVLHDRKAVLSLDASSEFSESKSLVGAEICSLMCAPLVPPGGTPLGVIQLHSTHTKARFTKAELGLLMAVANTAATALENQRLHERLVLQDRLQRDMEHARRVQRSFLPAAVPDVPGYRFFAHYAPAFRVGGDYYGFIARPDGLWGVGVGDVSGKGPSAALMMARLSSDVRFSVLQHADPSAALALVNASLAESDLDDRFVTMILGVLDPSDARLTLANAGHHPPLRRTAEGSVLPVREPNPGIPLNISSDPDLAPTSQAMTLGPGDVVVLYTDGITEAKSVDDEEFGPERLHAAIAGADGTPQAVGAAIVEAVDAFTRGRPPSDDITIVAFGREAP